MAMLAEPRRKQKYSIDPRGLNWSNDDNKFGQKLMEKMGWSKGKGLGANEDGKTDHVKVSVKNNSHGVGCSKSHADNWVAHQDDFNSLLATLKSENTTNEDSEKDDQVQSLEERSKSSKGRVHYKKFTRGKDLTNAKRDDLDCIFGRRKSKSAPSTPQTQSEANSDNESSSTKEDDKTHGFKTVTSTTSLQDYFAQKMAKIKARNAEAASGSAPLSRVQSSDEEKQMDDNDDEMETPVQTKKKKKSKKSKKERQDESADQTDETSVSPLESEEVHDVLTKKKKRKRDAIELSENMETLGEVEEEKPKKKKSKKHKKNKDKDNIAQVDGSIEVNNDEPVDSRTHKEAEHFNSEEDLTSEKSSKKEKKKDKDCDENVTHDPISESVDETFKYQSSKKRKYLKNTKDFVKNPTDYFKGTNLDVIPGYGK